MRGLPRKCNITLPWAGTALSPWLVFGSRLIYNAPANSFCRRWPGAQVAGNAWIHAATVMDSPLPMIKMLKSLFASRQPVDRIAVAQSEPAIAATSAEAEPAERAALDIGLDGWHNPVTDEVIPGFRVGPGDRVLDVGCGGAHHSRFCLQKGAHVTFTDIDAQVIAAAQRAFDEIGGGRAQGIVSDSYPLPVEAGSMTRVIATEVIEHVEDSMAFLRELHRVGQPGALYFLTVPDAISERMQQGIAPDSYFEHPNHIRILDHEQFARLVVDAGFVIESQKPYGAYWTLWWMFFWNSGVGLDNPSHPLLNAWAATWNELLKTPNPEKTIRVLDRHLPKSQVILARKP